MIAATDISLDDEAALYVNAFCHKRLNRPPPKIIVSRQSLLTRSASVGSFPGKIVCYRCGEVGHMSRSCPNQLPSLKQMEQEMENDIQQILSEVGKSPHLQRDEFGFYSTEHGSPIQPDVNFSQTKFCVNCSNPGHSHGECPHINFTKLSNDMKDCTQSNSRYSPQDVENFFWDLWN
jgi:hypothetical protein